MAEDGQDTAELTEGFARLYGIPRRDPTAYRPLVEFCFGLPTGLYRRNGIDRWLARAMGEGRLPEVQRHNRDQGSHEVDWHLRLGRARADLLDEVTRMEADPDIARVVDLARMRDLLEHFPEHSSWEVAVRGPYSNALRQGISAGRFIAYAKGRNDI
jgi:asparagine synthase (glutamine-hydrolysing)